MMRGLKGLVEERIQARGSGWIFTRKDFQDLAPSGPLGMALARLAASGRIRRLRRGLFEAPKMSRVLGEALPADLDQAAQAIARKHRWTITPEGALAANLLGLSEQVPARLLYLSDGPSRRITIGDRTIRFRHASRITLGMAQPASRMIALALKHLGRHRITPSLLDQLRKRLPRAQRSAFLQDARYGTDWIYAAARFLAGKEGPRE